MKKNDLHRLWFFQTPTYVLYFIRELTGFFIALYFVYFIVFPFLFGPVGALIHKVIEYSALVAALIHTITWLFVSTSVTSFDLKPAQQAVLFFFLILAWIAVSFFILRYLYVPF